MPTTFPKLEPAPPYYPIPDHLSYDCGYVTVPEYHQGSPDGQARSLRLYVTRIKSLSAHPAEDPIVFLHGGPGGSGVPGIIADEAFQKAWLSTRDLVFFDQRGTGHSEPSLTCPELAAAIPQWAGQPLTGEERAREYVRVVLACRDRLASEGIHFDAYNSTESAADIPDICRALGYRQVNLYSISYGTRLALAAMRDCPEVLRSVVLDSVVPMQVNQFASGKAGAAHAFKMLFGDVAADPVASQAYPDLENRFYALVEQLNRQPVTLTIPVPDTSETRPFFLNGEVLTGMVYLSFYGRDRIPSIPKMITETESGDTTLVSQIGSYFIRDEEPGCDGMYFSVNLFDDKVIPETRQAIRVMDHKYARIGWMPYTEFHLGEHIVDIAEKWGARTPGVAQYLPVYSDIPTLILTGRYDQNTPSYWGHLAGETLSHSYYFELGNVGHGALSSGEYMYQVLRDFYDAPEQEPDRTWMEQVPKVRFALPGEGGQG